ncbi:SAM-dependent methyltransferase [Streptomyces sp. NPDC093094]|uniref:SAM-dependent methyltransferase n=1 Tax=Streptomyces sp. NPDC093094 TaxID=3366026 RepID=UPI00382EF56C
MTAVHDRTTDLATPADWAGAAPAPIGVDHAFNGYVAGTVINALDRLGVWERLAAAPLLDLRALAVDLGPAVRERVLRELVRAAATCGWVRLQEDGDTALLTSAGQEIIRMRGYFTWGVGGYNEVFAQAHRIVTGEGAFGTDVLRDEAMVALGSGQNDRSFMSGTLDEVLADVDFSVLADLGSGISARVSRVVGERPGTRGLGLDISAPATELGVRTIAEAGLTGRVEAIRTDVLDVCHRDAHRDKLAQVDTVMSFFLLHDLLADPVTRPHTFTRLREAFPAARTFVLADTMLRPDAENSASLPVFSLGYELAHALMGVPLHTKETYEELFAAAGLVPRRIVPFGTPHSWLYVLEAR